MNNMHRHRDKRRHIVIMIGRRNDTTIDDKNTKHKHTVTKHTFHNKKNTVTHVAHTHTHSP